MALTLRHQTAQEFAQRLKARFRAAERYEKARIAAWIYQRFIDGDFTIAQLRAAFDLDTTEKWTAFRDRLMALKDHYDAIEAERVE